MKRAELKRGTKGLKRGKELARGTKGLKRKPAKRKASKSTWPVKVRRLTWKRDGGQCARCWSTWRLHLHHRRIKGIGGDPRPHTDCACDGVTLCERCHKWVHEEGRAEAEATGYIVSRSQPFPGSVSILIGAASGSGATVHLPCDKPYYTTPDPERRAA